MQFNQLPLDKKLLDAIVDCHYKDLTPIQKEVIPHILKNRDVQAIAPTGSGKTASFVLPMLNNLLKIKDKQNIKAMIIAPTKELVVQIEQNISKYAKYTNIKSKAIYGGTKILSDLKILNEKFDILVCTTGRIDFHIKEKNINLNNIKYLVLDESDTLLDMGFINEINLVLKSVPQDTQISLFSATMGKKVKLLSNRILKKNVCINIDKEQKATHKIDQSVYFVSKDEKIDLLSYIIGAKYKDSFIVFTRTKKGSIEVYNKLVQNGLKCLNLHGDMTQTARLKSIEEFKKNKAQVLVATDITARGIDIEELQYVINFDIPNSVDDYIHRIGRTSRADKKGSAINLVSSSELYSFKLIEKKLQLKITQLKEDGFGDDIMDDDKSIKIMIKKEKKSKTNGAYGNTTNDKKRKKLKGKRSGWNTHDNR